MCAEAGPRTQGLGSPALTSARSPASASHLLRQVGHILQVLRMPSGPVLLGSRLEPLQGPPHSPPPTSPPSSSHWW